MTTKRKRTKPRQKSPTKKNRPKLSSTESSLGLTGNIGDFLKIGVAAAARGNIEQVRAILNVRPKWVHHIGSHGRTMLWEACHRGKLDMVKYLVRRKADINACGSHYTPYFVEISCYCIARFKKRDDVAEFLINKGADVDIHTAAFLGDLKLVKQFLKKKRGLLNAGHPQHGMAGKNDLGLEFVLEPAKWATPLCYALRGGDVDTVQHLIERGARIKGLDECMFIAADDNPELVRILLENGANPRYAPSALPDDKELHAVVTACGVKSSNRELSNELVYLCRGDRGGNPGEVQRLLDAGADVNFQDAKGMTAMHRAAKAAFVDTMQVLVDNGASIHIEDNEGETPLFAAVRSTVKDQTKRRKAIDLLQKLGASTNHENRKNKNLREVARKLKVSLK